MKKYIFKDILVRKTKFFFDNRGIFFEMYKHSNFKKNVKNFFLQDNFSYSKKGVLRGLHFQKKKPQGKLLTLIEGKIFDVVVDLRKEKKTFGMWNSYYLSHKEKNQIWIPPGFAHGFMSLSKKVNIIYKCTEEYDPKDEKTIFWNDKKLQIKWPNGKKILSKKDNNPSLTFSSYFY